MAETGLVLWCCPLGLEVYNRALNWQYIKALVAPSNRPEWIRCLREISSVREIPLLVQPLKRDGSAFQDFVKSLQRIPASCYLFNAYSMIVPESVFSIPVQGSFNIHWSLLPEYRGANTLNWTLVNGEERTGVTIHMIDQGVDTGPVVVRKEIEIEPEDNAVTLRDRLAVLCTEMIKETVPRMLSGSVELSRQDEKKAVTWPRRKPEDGFFDWSWPAKRIHNLIRALVEPWPGAYYLNREGIRITISQHMTYQEVVTFKTKHEFDVCKDAEE